MKRDEIRKMKAAAVMYRPERSYYFNNNKTKFFEANLLSKNSNIIGFGKS